MQKIVHFLLNTAGFWFGCLSTGTLLEQKNIRIWLVCELEFIPTVFPELCRKIAHFCEGFAEKCFCSLYFISLIQMEYYLFYYFRSALYIFKVCLSYRKMNPLRNLQSSSETQINNVHMSLIYLATFLGLVSKALQPKI